MIIYVMYPSARGFSLVHSDNLAKFFAIVFCVLNVLAFVRSFAFSCFMFHIIQHVINLALKVTELTKT